jgi:hypothetical protein
MPCWVAPVVAAELWGVTPSHVLCAIADGSLPSKQEYGFVLVDVAPEGTCPAPRRQGPPPPTYVVVSYDEPQETAAPAPVLEAIDSSPVPPPQPEPLPEPVPVWAPPDATDAVDDEIPPLDEEEDDKPISHWRQVRSNMGRMRTPPRRTPPPSSACAA